MDLSEEKSKIVLKFKKSQSYDTHWYVPICQVLFSREKVWALPLPSSQPSTAPYPPTLPICIYVV